MLIMRDLAEFEKWQIVEARLAETSVTKTAELLGLSRVIISRTITDLKKHGNPSSSLSKSGRISKLIPTETDIRIVQFRPNLFAVSSI